MWCNQETMTNLFNEMGLFIRILSWSLMMPLLVRCIGIQRLVYMITPRSSIHWSRPNLAHHINTLLMQILANRRLGTNSPTCLLRSLILYRVLRRYDYDASINFGVKREDDHTIKGHSWIILDDEVFLEDEHLVSQCILIYEYSG
jgi:hypothetical protein